jgi:hypothetical protein
VKVPIEVKIIIEVMPHERLVGELLVHKFVEESNDLRLYIGLWRSGVTAESKSSYGDYWGY